MNSLDSTATNAAAAAAAEDAILTDELNTAENQQLLLRDVSQQQQKRVLPLQVNATVMRSKQRKFAQQRSILKNSQERTYVEENEVLEAKKQLILRRRRLFSHYRQYEQWRRRQFSYDPSYFRPPALPIGQMACHDYDAYGSSATSMGNSANFGGNSGAGGAVPGAGRRRRQYRRQYSCADRSRDGSRESRSSSRMHKYHSMVGSDTIHTDSSVINRTNYSEPASFDSSECGGTFANPPLHSNSPHIHMLAEEHSTSISERCTRSRINSAIFVSSEGRGFDSIEFLRRHGSQSVLCRKAKSAENITGNVRKKSYADKRLWRTDDESIKQQNTSQDSNDIEMKECGGGVGELLTLPVLNAEPMQSTPGAVTGLLARSAAITTANVIVGSISLEAPPPYMQQDEDTHSDSAHLVEATTSQDSGETVEELVHVPLLASVQPPTPAPSIAIETKPHVLVHQRSSTASSSPHSSPKNLGLKIVKPKISAVPMVSVSGPSPPIEKPPLAECL